MNGKRIAVLSTALLVWAQAAGAQVTHEHPAQRDSARMGHDMMCSGMGGMGMGGGMQMRMSVSGLPSPAQILRAAEVLGLTPDQRARIEAIQTGHSQAAEPHMKQMMAAYERLAAAVKGDQPDVAAYEAALREAMGQMAALHIAAARAGLQARNILTTDQRARFESLVTMMEAMMCGSSAGAMSHGAP
jgi:Spy/CpxP family protein refolding chaperone